jgi:dihydrodipicolinate synthase/N-acetylneuraminate lyase
MAARLRGLVVALATPLQDDGSVDREALARLVDYVAAGGAVGIFVLSSTGEGPMLPEEQQRAAVESAVAAAQGRLAVLCNISDTGTTRVLRRAEQAAELGADYLVCTLPFYFHHRGQEILDFYYAVADVAARPLLIYNVPCYTGVQITPGQVGELAAHPNIVGIKDSTQDWVAFQRIVRLKDQRPEWMVFNGDEEALASSVLMGADGGVLGLGNVAPRLCAELFAAADRGDLLTARRLQSALADLQQLWSLAGDAGHGCLKLALHLLGFCQPHVSAPLRPAPPELRPRVAALLARHGLL